MGCRGARVNKLGISNIANSIYSKHVGAMRVHPINDELRRCYQEVNQALPWLTEQGLDLLSAKHLENWNQSLNFWQLQKEDPELLSKITTAAGLKKGSGGVDQFMNVSAQLFFYTNKIRNCRENMIEWGVGDDFPVVWKASFNCCQASMLRHNDIVKLSEFLALPLPECSHLVCQCDVIMLQTKRYDRYRK
jgi:hypothetical protein